MIGSLGQFINTSEDQCFKFSSTQPLDILLNSKNKRQHRKYKISKTQHQPQDKSQILKIYDRRHHQTLSSHKDQLRRSSVKSSNITKKNSYIDHTFFINHRIKDQISVSNLNNNHSLLKAIVKTNEAQANKRHQTVFDESFQRIKLGFSSLNIPRNFQPIQQSKPSASNAKEINKVRTSQYAFITKSNINKNKIHFEKCRRWAQKHGMTHGKNYYEKVSRGPQHKKTILLATNQEAFEQTRKCLIKQINEVLSKFRNIKSVSSVKASHE